MFTEKRLTVAEVRALPPPGLFPAAQAGCRASLNALMRAHEGLVQAAVRRQVTGSAAFDELLQAGHRLLDLGWRHASHERETGVDVSVGFHISYLN